MLFLESPPTVIKSPKWNLLHMILYEVYDKIYVRPIQRVPELYTPFSYSHTSIYDIFTHIYPLYKIYTKGRMEVYLSKLVTALVYCLNTDCYFCC